MKFTKGQIGMITNMVNCELGNSNTVYDIVELENLKKVLISVKNVEVLAEEIFCLSPMFYIIGCVFDYNLTCDGCTYQPKQKIS